VLIKVWRNNFIAKLATARDRPAHKLKASRWDKLLNLQLNKEIVPAAMELLVKQLYLMDDHLRTGACSGFFEQIHGIPCYHTLRQCKDRNVTVTKQDFHKH
jgi:hypothetical protein